VTAATRVVRPCWRCQHPTPIQALVEVHFGPSPGNHKADIVNWLCSACALAVTRPTRPAARRRR
jgi:hypothetical protein